MTKTSTVEKFTEEQAIEAAVALGWEWIGGSQTWAHRPSERQARMGRIPEGFDAKGRLIDTGSSEGWYLRVSRTLETIPLVGREI